MAIIATLATAFCMIAHYKLCGFWYFATPVTIWRLFNSILLTFAGGVFIVGRGIINPAWYLCVLIYCYVIFGLIQNISTSKRVDILFPTVFMMLLGEGLIAYEINLPYFNSLTGRGYSAFYLGGVVAYIWKYKRHRWTTCYSIITICFCIFTYVTNFDMFAENQRSVLTYVLYPAVLFAVLFLEEYFKRFAAKIEPITTFLGGISYEMYLWHIFCLCFADIMLQEEIIEYLYSRTMMLIFLGVMIVFSALIYITIEVPINRNLIQKSKNRA